jgi:hypothetical protein
VCTASRDEFPSPRDQYRDAVAETVSKYRCTGYRIVVLEFTDLQGQDTAKRGRLEPTWNLKEESVELDTANMLT